MEDGRAVPQTVDAELPIPQGGRVRRHLMAAWALSICIALHAPLAGADLVNGSFERQISPIGFYRLGPNSNAIEGWTSIGSGAEWYSPAFYGLGPAVDGNNVVDLTPGTSREGGIRQEFYSVAGGVYRIDFWLGTIAASGADSSAVVEVLAGNTQQSYRVTGNSDRITWQLHSFEFVATFNWTSLVFRCRQDATFHFAYLDDVHMTTTVPAQTSTWGRVKALYR